MSTIAKYSSMEVQQARASIRAATLHKREAIAQSVARARQIAIEREVVGQSIKLKRGRPRKGSGASPNFAVPAKRKRELRSSSGLRAFHFAFSSVTRTQSKRGTGSARNYAKAAPVHIVYIEDGAISRTEHNVYIDSSRVEADEDGARLVRSNISNHYHERVEFFRLVDQHERVNRGDKVDINFARNWQKWLAVTCDPDCDPAVRKAFGEWVANPSRKKPFNISLDGTASDLRIVMKRHGFVLRPVTNAARLASDGYCFHDGRGGRTEYRLVFELPREFNQDHRVEALERLCSRIGALGCMYVGVIHAPDPHNDRDNYHIHLDYYDRPCRRLDGTDDDLRNVDDGFRAHIQQEMREGKFRHAIGQWDFTVERRYASNKRTKIHAPFTAKKVNATRERSFVRKLRTDFAQDINAVATKAGEREIYDAGTYAAMGIIAPASNKLGPAAHGLETKGIPTTIGIANEEAQAFQDRAVIEQTFADSSRELDAAHLAWEQTKGEQDTRLMERAAEVDKAIVRTRIALEIRRDLELLQLEQERERSRANLVIERQSSLMKSGTAAARNRAAALVQEAKKHIVALEDGDRDLVCDQRLLAELVEQDTLAQVNEALSRFHSQEFQIRIRDDLDGIPLENATPSTRRNIMQKRPPVPSVPADAVTPNAVHPIVTQAAVDAVDDKPTNEPSAQQDGERARPRDLLEQLLDAAASQRLDNAPGAEPIGGKPPMQPGLGAEPSHSQPPPPSWVPQPERTELALAPQRQPPDASLKAQPATPGRPVYGPVIDGRYLFPYIWQKGWRLVEEGPFGREIVKFAQPNKVPLPIRTWLAQNQNFAGWFYSFQQQMLRADERQVEAPSKEEATKAAAAAAHRQAAMDAAARRGMGF